MAEIANARVSGGQFSFDVHGEPGGTIQILASTDVSLPTANWSVIATNTLDAQGNFTAQYTIAAGAGPVFYRIAIPLPPDEQILQQTIARFKTPTVRDLGHSTPYFHTGSKDTFEDVIRFYQMSSAKARLGQVRNADIELGKINLDDDTIAPLAAFLRALNEDYTD